MTEPPRVLFVCTANISRSPWAEHRFRAMVPGFDVCSAGVVATPGRSMDPVMAALLPAKPSHVSQPLSGQLVASSALILTMERVHLVKLLDEWPGSYGRAFTLGQFARTLAVAPGRLGLSDLLSWAQEHRVAVDNADDIADPYGRGREAAEQCAATIESYLRVVAAGLVAAVARR